MSRKEEMEIRNQAVRLYPQCVALFELPTMVYAQIFERQRFEEKAVSRELGAL